MCISSIAWACVSLRDIHPSQWTDFRSDEVFFAKFVPATSILIGPDYRQYSEDITCRLAKSRMSLHNNEHDVNIELNVIPVGIQKKRVVGSFVSLLL